MKNNMFKRFVIGAIFIIGIVIVLFWQKTNVGRHQPQASPISETKRYSEEEARTLIDNRAAQVIGVLKQKDLKTLSSFVHPKKGLRFSPYSYIDTEKDLIFTSEQLETAFEDPKKYIWGAYDGSGFPIELNVNEYFQKFVYS